jgi:hypothetical protein
MLPSIAKRNEFQDLMASWQGAGSAAPYALLFLARFAGRGLPVSKTAAKDFHFSLPALSG